MKKERNLTWKLKELPTGAEVSALVEAGVITKEEARDIVLGDDENKNEVIETLQEQIHFLQGIIKDLSNRAVNTTPLVVKEVSVSRPYWDKYWMSTSTALNDAGFRIGEHTDGNTNHSKVVFSAKLH